MLFHSSSSSSSSRSVEYRVVWRLQSGQSGGEGAPVSARHLPSPVHRQILLLPVRTAPARPLGTSSPPAKHSQDPRPGQGSARSWRPHGGILEESTRWDSSQASLHNSFQNTTASAARPVSRNETAPEWRTRPSLGRRRSCSVAPGRSSCSVRCTLPRESSGTPGFPRWPSVLRR